VDESHEIRMVFKQFATTLLALPGVELVGVVKTPHSDEHYILVCGTGDKPSLIPKNIGKYKIIYKKVKEVEELEFVIKAPQL
jgi:hypothetical protein